MAKTKMNFRLSDDALMALARLSGLWGCDRTAVIERALAEADPSEMDQEERESTEASMVEILPPQAMKAPQDLPLVKDTRTRQEKADDFYRANMAKGKK